MLGESNDLYKSLFDIGYTWLETRSRSESRMATYVQPRRRSEPARTGGLFGDQSIRKLDESFFRVRFDRLTPLEREYMRYLAELGEGPQRSSDVAKAMKRSASSLGPTRDNLIKKGMIYAPEHGQVAFTVPLFDEFMRREMRLP